jgi:polysaccharide biosynthesis transport protein
LGQALESYILSTELAEIDGDPPAPSGPGLFTILWRRKAYLVFGAVVGLGLGYLDYLRRDRVYQSTAQLLVKRRNDQIQVAGPAVAPGVDSRVAFIDDFLATQEALIRSNEVLVKAGRHLANAELEKPPPGGDCVAYIGAGLTVSRVQTGAGTANNILNISFRGPSSMDCEAAVNAVIAAYTESLDGGVETATKRDLERLTKTKETINAELTDLDKKFSAAHKLVDAKSSTPLEDIKKFITQYDTKKLDYVQRQSDLELLVKRVEEGQAAKRDPRVLLRMLQNFLDKSTERPVPVRPDPPRAVETRPMEDSLAALRREARRLEDEGFGKEYPRLKAILKQIAEAEAELRSGPMPPPRAVAGPTKSADEEEVEHLVEGLKLDIAVLRDRISDLETKTLDPQRKLARELSTLVDDEAEILAQQKRLQANLAATESQERRILETKEARLYEARAINPAGPGAKIAPVLFTSLALALALGLAGGGGLAYLAEFTDKSFRTPDEIRRRLGLAVVGHIPSLPPNMMAGAGASPIDARIIVHHRPKSTESEAYRGVRTALYFSTRGKGHQVIQVTSPNPGDGKSTLSANLAVAIAQSGKRVVLIDCDFRKPRVHKIFGVTSDVGLASVITGDSTLAQATQPSGIANLSLLPCGPRPANPAELLTSQRFVEVLDEIKKGYDFVLIDTPPLLAVSDPAVVAPRVDGVLMTIRITSRTRPAAERARETLAALGANVIGVVVNDLQGSKRRGGYGQGYGYGYGYGYTYGYGYRYQYNYAYGYAENYGETGDESGEFAAAALPAGPSGLPALRHLN